MIHWSRTASTVPGKLASAQAFAAEAVAYAKAKHGQDLVVSMPVGGNPNRIRWSTQFSSLAAYETYVEGLRADPGYAALLSKGTDCFIAGSMVDEFWRSM